jgi:hypothetical protein
MGRGIVNIIIGGVFLVGGGTGQLVLFGTDSTGAIMAVGGGLVLYGLFRIVQGSKQG